MTAAAAPAAPEEEREEEKEEEGLVNVHWRAPFPVRTSARTRRPTVDRTTAAW